MCRPPVARIVVPVRTGRRSARDGEDRHARHHPPVPALAGRGRRDLGAASLLAGSAATQPEGACVLGRLDGVDGAAGRALARARPTPRRTRARPGAPVARRRGYEVVERSAGRRPAGARASPRCVWLNGGGRRRAAPTPPMRAGRERIDPAVRDVEGIVATYVLRGADDARIVVVALVTALEVLDDIRRAVFATDLLPVGGPGPADRPRPDRRRPRAASPRTADGGAVVTARLRPLRIDGRHLDRLGQPHAGRASPSRTSACPCTGRSPAATARWRSTTPALRCGRGPSSTWRASTPGIARRDPDLRKPRFLDIDRHPVMIWAADRFTPARRRRLDWPTGGCRCAA